MLGETARADGKLPDSRAELFKRACKLMLREESEPQQSKPHAHRSQDELLLSAGAICATQLLCDREGVYDGPYMKTPDGLANVADIQKLRLGEAARDALRFRLFRVKVNNASRTFIGQSPNILARGGSRDALRRV